VRYDRWTQCECGITVAAAAAAADLIVELQNTPVLVAIHSTSCRENIHTLKHAVPTQIQIGFIANYRPRYI